MDFGSIAGAALGGLGGLLGSNSGDAVTTTEPWKPQANYLKDIFGQAQQQYQGYTPQYYPGQTIAGFSQPQLAAQNYLQNYASGVQPFINQTQATNRWMQTDALDPDSNRYLQSAVQSAARPITQNLMEQVMPRIRADYRRGQPFGGSKEQQAVGLATGRAADAIGDISSRMYSNAYGQGLSAANQAMAMAPGMAQMGAYPAQLMSGVGGQQQAMNQARMGDAQQRWNYYQQMPWNKLDRYSSLVGGNQWGGQTSTPVEQNQFANTLGGMFSGMGLAQTLGGGGSEYGSMPGFGFGIGPWGVS